MANRSPTPKPENLGPPWPPGTSSNPASYSRGRRIGGADVAKDERRDQEHLKLVDTVDTFDPAQLDVRGG